MEQSAVCTQTAQLKFCCVLNSISNPTCLMRFETEALRDCWFYGHYTNPCMYVCMLAYQSLFWGLQQNYRKTTECFWFICDNWRYINLFTYSLFLLSDCAEMRTGIVLLLSWQFSNCVVKKVCRQCQQFLYRLSLFYWSERSEVAFLECNWCNLLDR